MYVKHTGERSGTIEPRRDQAERLVRLADHLPASDQALLRTIYDRGLTASELSRVIGNRPRSVRRRLNRIVQRVVSPVFRFVVRERSHWPPLRQRVAELVCLHGCSQRAAADRLEVSVHVVRTELEHIRALLEREQMADAADPDLPHAQR